MLGKVESRLLPDIVQQTLVTSQQVFLMFISAHAVMVYKHYDGVHKQTNKHEHKNDANDAKLNGKKNKLTQVHTNRNTNHLTMSSASVLMCIFC